MHRKLDELTDWINVKVKIYIRGLLCWFLIGLGFSLSVEKAISTESNLNPSKEHPNVIVIFIDDMGWSDLSCFGGKHAVTENIDRLAAEGIRFKQFYVNAPICSPSRVALTTGQYPQRWKITSFLNNRKNNEERGMAQWLDTQAPTLPRQLQLAGYATGHFGKWHMGGQRDVDNAPPISRYGFDASLTNFEGMGAKLLPLTIKPGQAKAGRIWEDAVRLGEPVTWMQRSEITGGFVRAALEFIDRAQQAKRPFYVNIWPDDVHSPFFPPLDKWAENKQDLYNSVLDVMDEQLAALFDRIRGDVELCNNTVILLCSDNGPENGAGSCEPLRGAKTWLYEGGVRSPLIVWGPGLLAEGKSGQINEHSCFCALDMNRSLYSLCHIDLPEAKLDGEDLAETLLGKGQASRQAPIFWQRPPDRPGMGFGFQEDNPDLSVRHGKWKYYVNDDSSQPQLYDLDADPVEANNVVVEHPQIAQALHELVFAWATEVQVNN